MGSGVVTPKLCLQSQPQPSRRCGPESWAPWQPAQAGFFRGLPPAVYLGGGPSWSWKEPVLGVWTDPQCLPCLPPLLSLLLLPPSRSHLNYCHGLLPCVPSEILVPSLHSSLLQTGLLQLPCQSHLFISLRDLSQCANVLCLSVHLPTPAISLWKENSMKAGGRGHLRYAPANPGR